MKTLLEINNLKVIFHLSGQDIVAVEDAHLSIAENETLVLAGESGSGKTVTALAITRLLPKNASIASGEVRFFGQDLLKLDMPELEKIRGNKIAYIFQEPASFLNPLYTIGNQIMEAIMLHQAKTRAQALVVAEELLNQVQIKDPRRVMLDYPHQLSGGMNQRAFLAMSLACKPKLMIADEPTTALDVTVEAAILELLMKLKQSLGFSLLFITHNLSIAKRIADRVCIMHRGKVVEEESREAIFSAPRHFHTKELLSAYEKIGKI